VIAFGDDFSHSFSILHIINEMNGMLSVLILLFG